MSKEYSYLFTVFVLGKWTPKHENNAGLKAQSITGFQTETDIH